MQNRLLQNTGIPSTPTSPDRQPIGGRHFRVFVISFSISCAIGMVYTFIRPAVYRSTATLLVTPHAPLDKLADVSEASTVAVQRHVISHPSVFAQTYRQHQKAAEGEWQIELADLESMLSAVVVADTNILELRAEGEARTELAPLINAWIEAYFATQSPARKVTSQSANEVSQQQLRELGDKVQVKRDELADFRLQHDIVSMQREENRVLMRLKGLATSLNKSEEAEVSAQAQVASLKAAIAENKQLPIDSEHLVALEVQAAELNRHMQGLEATYAADYLANDKEYTDLRKQHDLLIETIEAEYADQVQRQVAQAELEHDTAMRAVALTQDRLEQHKQRAAEFTTHFATHDGLLAELAQVEEIHRQFQQRTLHSEVLRDTLPPEISVLQEASLPQKPVRPDYHRDALICLGSSLLLGLSAMLIDFLLTRPISPVSVSESRTVFFPMSEAPVLLESNLPVATTAVPAIGLGFNPPRELSSSDVTALLQQGEGLTPSLVAGLVSGLKETEICELRRSHLDLDASLIRVPGYDSRVITIAPAAVKMLVRLGPINSQPSDPVWSNGQGIALTTEAIDSLIISSAHTAGLDRPTEVNAETLRFTYIAFLVRQGFLLAQLPGLVGQIAPATMSQYELLSPPGPGVILDHGQCVYPALG
jgi:succinoglycan biosynthesis transport protein ExoP